MISITVKAQIQEECCAQVGRIAVMMVMQMRAMAVVMVVFMVMITAIFMAVFVMVAMVVTHRRTSVWRSSERNRRRDIHLQHNVALDRRFLTKCRYRSRPGVFETDLFMFDRRSAGVGSCEGKKVNPGSNQARSGRHL